MKKSLVTPTLALCLTVIAPFALASWSGDEIFSTVADGNEFNYDWPSNTATVDFLQPEFVSEFTNATIVADFTAELLFISYTNTSQFENITLPPLEFEFLDLDVGGTGILGVNLVQSSFTGEIHATPTGADSIVVLAPQQNTNPGQTFLAIFQIVTDSPPFTPDLNVTISGLDYSFDYAHNLGVINTGFTLLNPTLQTLSIISSFEPDIGLQPNEQVQSGFVIYDGTLLLEVAAVDPQAGRRNLVTTYRMNVDPRMLRRDFLRARYVRQGVIADGRRAVRAARAARLSDARIMRFVEDDGRWIRAARVAGRADGRRIQPRFFPRMEPDGVVGHYGTFEKEDGSAYVWAVMDRNSRYAVGLNSDDDNDGIFNASDNCRNIANTNQLDTDGNGDGNECDVDDDADGVVDEVDNCPLVYNPGQEDVCTDADGDGVGGVLDECPDTAAGAVVDESGCSIDDTCPCDIAWKNHGAYVSCVAHRANDFLAQELISSEEKDLVMTMAGESGCGKKH